MEKSRYCFSQVRPLLMPCLQILEARLANPDPTRPPTTWRVTNGERYGDMNLLPSCQLCRCGLYRLVIAVHVCWCSSSVALLVTAPVPSVSLAHIMRASAARMRAALMRTADEVLVESMRLCVNVRMGRHRVVFVVVVVLWEIAFALW